MVFVLTALTLSTLINFRREVQSIYFYYFSAENIDKGVNFLRLRTVLIKGVEKMDMEGQDLRRKVDEVLDSQAVYGKMFGELLLPDYHQMFKYEARRRELEFYREMMQQHELNYICKKWMGRTATDPEKFEAAKNKIDVKMAKHSGKRLNSGYAFACFSSFTAIKKLKETLER